MQYLVAVQVLCGCFAAFVAGRKGRGRLAWFGVGMLLPIVGVVLACLVRPRAARRKAPERVARARSRRRPPRRCSGSYIPDCLGCSFFVKPLFDPSYCGSRKGRCERFGRELVEETQEQGSQAVFDNRSGPS